MICDPAARAKMIGSDRRCSISGTRYDLRCYYCCSFDAAVCWLDAAGFAVVWSSRVIVVVVVVSAGGDDDDGCHGL